MFRLVVWSLIAALGSFPGIKLFLYYSRTKIRDYALLGSAFVIAVAEVLIILVLENGNEALYIYQINDILYPTFILMFLIHGLRMQWRWRKIPMVILYFSFMWYLLLIVSVLLYKMQTLPDSGTLLFFKVKNAALISYGPLFIIHDTIIMGRGFELLAHLFRIYTITIVLLSYLNTEDLAKLIQVKIARRVFLISILAAMVFPIVLVGEMLYWWEIAESIEWHIFDLITFVGVAYISIRYPQTLLISKTQVLRTLELLDTFHIDLTKDLGQHEVGEYLILINKSISEKIHFRN